MQKTKFFSLSWSDARLLDLWAIVHFVSGVFYGPLFLLLRVSFWPGLIIVTAAAVAFEFGEYLWGVSENLENIVIDIVLAQIGYAVYVRLFSGREKTFHWKVMIILAIVNLTLTYLGYLNYRQRIDG